MAFTKIVSPGIDTTGSYTVQELNTVGVMTAGTVQVGSATTVHTTGIDLGSGNITSHNINSTGIITATSFVGPVSATNGTFSGNVSIGGTLTYEDVTNIDSVGIITARDGIHVTGGSVGIGTDAPGMPLEVLTHNSTLGIRINRYHSGSYYSDIIHTASPEGLAFRIGDGSTVTERLRITGIGSVGIGTANPATKLNVVGDARVEGFSNAKIQIKRTGNTVANGSIEFLGSDNSFGWGLIANYDAGGSNFNIKEGSVSRLYIKSGSVGIGTETPTGKLEVVHSSQTNLLTLKRTSGNSGVFNISLGGAEPGTIFSTSGTCDDFVFNTSNEALRITSDGKIGLGMTNPVAKLHIGTENDTALTAQTLFVEGAKTGFANYTGLPQNQLCLYDNTTSTSGSGGAISFAANCGGSQQTWIAAIESQRDSGTNDASNYAGSIVFWTRPAQSTPTEKLRITSVGRVGIGTGVPLGALHIHANQGTDTALWIGDNSSSRYLAINEQSSSSSFNNVITRYNDNGIHAHYILDNPYAQGTGYGSQILFRGNNQGTTAYIETSNEESGSARGTLRLRGADNHGLDVRSTGEVNTTHASNIGYATNAATNTRSLVYTSLDPQKRSTTAAEWYILKTFHPNKSGTVNMHAQMYITSGQYYFTFRVREEGTDEIVFNAGDNGGYGAYATNGNAVHSYKQYKWICPKIKAHKRYYIEMAGSNSAGTSINFNSSQQLFLKDLYIYSMSGGHSESTGAMMIQQSYDEASSTSYGGTTRAAMSGNVNRDSLNSIQYFAGTESTFLGWFTSRAYNRYLDFELNMTGSYMWFAQAYGYLYSSGQVAGSMISGYTYTNNQILNKYNHTFGNRGWYGSYRTSNGNLCLKFDRGGNGYSEGRIALFLGTHGPSNPEWRVLRYRQNDTTSNIF